MKVQTRPLHLHLSLHSSLHESVSDGLLRQGSILPQVAPFRPQSCILLSRFLTFVPRTDTSTHCSLSFIANTCLKGADRPTDRPYTSSLSLSLSCTALLRPHIYKKARDTLESTATSFSNSNILMDDFATRTIPTTGTTRSSAKKVRTHDAACSLLCSSIHLFVCFFISVGRSSGGEGIEARRRAKRDHQVRQFSFPFPST